MNDQKGDGQQAQFVWNGRRNTVVSVFPWGFRLTKNSDVASGRWEEIDYLTKSITRHLYNGSHTYTEYRYNLLMASAQVVKLAGTLRPADAHNSAKVDIFATPGTVRAITIEQLGRILEARVTSVQLPAAIARFRAGESTSFGKLKVGLRGISTDYGSVAWDEIQDVQTRSGVVSVKKEGKWLSWKNMAVGQVLNYDVFDALVHTILVERIVGKDEQTP